MESPKIKYWFDVYFMDSPILKLMITGGTPMTMETSKWSERRVWMGLSENSVPLNLLMNRLFPNGVYPPIHIIFGLSMK